MSKKSIKKIEETTLEIKMKEHKDFYKNNKFNDKILIVGTGAFGTALANVFSRRNTNVLLYGIDEKEVKDINDNHKNSKYFSKQLSTSLTATSNIEEALENVEVIILAIPSHAFSPVLEKVIVPKMKNPAYFINVAKGLDNLKVQLLSTLIDDVVPKKLNKGILKLAGPSYAQELIYNTPTTFVLASEDIEVSKEVSKYFITDVTNIIPSDNLKGVELISVLKNPLAILLGIVNGLGYGFNAKARILVDALEEMKKILEFFNMDTQIIMSPAGVGDLYLTGSSKKSRNFSTGYQIGRANKVNKKILSSFTTIEGLRSIELILSFATKNNIELKLFNVLYEITYNKVQPKLVISNYFKDIY